LIDRLLFSQGELEQQQFCMMTLMKLSCMIEPPLSV